MAKLTRRELLKVLGTSTITAVPFSLAAYSSHKKDKLKILVTGAHPDDPKTGCGGTVARYAQAGHEVVALYLTRGEGGIQGASHEEAAQIRTNEAIKACKIMDVRPIFTSQIDGNTKVNNQQYGEIRKMIEQEGPDLLFTQWPVDSHRDHRAVSLLVYDAWLAMGKGMPLYYYEVMSGIQTQNFNPTDYVDITTTYDLKREACLAHESQNPEELIKIHEQMSQFRGMEYGCEHAEAFVKHEQSPPFSLIGSG